ncbi:MAG: hypothetical protein DDT34_01531 [Firmicutes bacterium]|nr:hypothetical protein [Bacillota bacterium]
MLPVRRPLFFRLGRLEVFAERWNYPPGIRPLQTMSRTTNLARELEVWLPGLHLVVCMLRRREVTEESA